MKIYFERIEGKGVKFALFLAILIIIAVLGFYYSYLMFTGGYYITGMTNSVPWGVMKVFNNLFHWAFCRLSYPFIPFICFWKKGI